jgi:hypothetical protein
MRFVLVMDVLNLLIYLCHLVGDLCISITTATVSIFVARAIFGG